MSATTVSGSAPASDDGLLRNTFHVVPPPPPRQKAWSELAIVVGLALLINLIVILSFIQRAPVAMPPADPPAISVDLVQEPQPEPQQPEPEPEPQPEPEKVEKRGDWGTSGDESGRPSAYLETDDESEEVRQTDLTEETSRSDSVTTEKKEDGSVDDIPGWARTVTPGFDMRVGSRDARSEDKQAEKAAGGGDTYSNLVKSIINANARIPTGAKGTVKFHLAVMANGRITHAVPSALSGNRALDEAVWEAIRRSSPLPPPPSERMAAEILILPYTLSVGN